MVVDTFVCSSRASESNEIQEARHCAVTFQLLDTDQVPNTTPSDSNNSNASSGGGYIYTQSPSTPESAFAYPEDDRLDFYLSKFDRHAYRLVNVSEASDLTIVVP